MHPIDQVFMGALQGSEMDPPSDSWYNITRELDRKKQVPMLNAFRLLAASVALAISFGGGYYWAMHRNVSRQAVASTQPKSEMSAPVVTGNAVPVAAAGTGNARSISSGNSGNHKQTDPANNPVSSVSGGVINTQKDNDQQLLTEPAPVRLSPLLALVKGTPAVSAAVVFPGDYGTAQAAANDEKEIVYDNTGNNNTKHSITKWSLGGQVSPLYAFRSTKTENAGAGMGTTAGSQTENGLLSYGGGLNVEFKASRRWSVASGLYYSRMGQSVQGSEMYAASVASNAVDAVFLSSPKNATNVYIYRNSMGTIESRSAGTSAYGGIAPSTVQNVLISTSDQSVNLVQSMDFLEIPVLVRYKVIDRKLGLHLLGGIATNILTGNRVQIDQGSGLENYGRTIGLTTFNYSSTLGVGLDYSFNNNLRMNLEPAFKYYLNSINTNSSVDTHPYSFGIYSGISYSF